ncbi:MAG: hypothetical protein QG567_2319 [Campylobacterota bacterium]|nr:hypothetical protein [Campylobacterota bacterium]
MIYKKINDVMKKVGFVTKDTTVGFGNNSYKAVSHDKVTEIVRPFFADAGIMIVPRQTAKGISIDGKTSKGNDKIRFEALYDIDFIDCEDESKLTVTIEAHAEGSDDKCAGKALSYAVKNAILKVLMLETGENDEEGVKNTIDIKQTGMLAQLIADTGTDIKKFCEAYKINTVAELPSGYFTQALHQLQAKKKKGNVDEIKDNSN